jgi:cytochrome c556
MNRPALAAAALLLAASAPAFGQEEEVKPDLSDPVSLRMNMMSDVGAAIGPLVKMIKGEAEYDAQLAEMSFRVMNAVALGYADQFPEGSDTGHGTEAAPKIWEDKAGFEKAVAGLLADTEAALAAKPADLESFKPVFGKVSQNCKNCHESYRIDKD